MIAQGSHLRRLLGEVASAYTGFTSGFGAGIPEVRATVCVLSLVIRKPLYFTDHPLAITIPGQRAQFP